MEGIGEILREARERKGVSLEIIEETTKINKRYLLALESEDWARMPGVVYAKGFLRTYARFLALDEQPICDLFELTVAAQNPEKNETGQRLGSKGRKTKKQKPQKEVDLHNKPKRNMVFILCVLSVIILTFCVWAYKTYYLNGLEADRSPLPPIVLPPPAPATDPEPYEDELLIQPPAVFTSFSVVLEATELCWLRLRDQDTLVYEGTMRIGDVQEFSDVGKIEIRIGNAGGLIMTLNGIEMPYFGTSGQIVTKCFSIVDGVMVDIDTGEALS